MRHRKKFNHLSRKTAHRKAMLANMACSLIEHKRINTTVAKAKALKLFVEPLITKSKTDSTHSRRTAFRHLRSKDAVSELFREVAPKIADRPGGYTRIIKTGFRLGDSAEMCLIELVDFNELYVTEKKETKTKTRRSRRGGKKKDEGSAAETKSESTEEVKAVEEPKAEETKDTTSEASASTKEEAPVSEEPKEEPKAEAAEEPKAENQATEEPKAEKAEATEGVKEEKKEEKAEAAPEAKTEEAAPEAEAKEEDEKAKKDKPAEGESE